jgi:hypothetical protein
MLVGQELADLAVMVLGLRELPTQAVQVQRVLMQTVQVVAVRVWEIH